MKKKRVLYLDLLKILAAFFVIFNHYCFIINPDSFFSKILLTILFSICKIAVPLFIMVSGALLLGKKTSYKEIFSKRIVRIFVPLVVVSIIYVFVYGDGLNFNNIFSFIISLFMGYDENYIPYWIWYLYMLIGLYIMTPFLQKMLKGFKDNDYKVFFVIFLVAIGLFNALGPLSSVFGEEKNINSHFMNSLFSISVGYYVWGYYISKLKLNKNKVKVAWLTLILSLFFEVLFVNYAVYYKDFTYDDVINWSVLFVALPSASLFLIFKYYFKNSNNLKISKTVSIISDSSFGVYLTHVFLFDYLQKISIIQNVLNYNSFIGCILMVFIAFVCLTVFFYFLKKIPIFRKFL